ncbi:polysaccharide deacetylase, partial [candidate division TM7 genomosp. GTL1]
HETNPKTNTRVAKVSFHEAKLKAILDKLLKQTTVAPTPTIVNNGVVIQQGENGWQAKDSHSLAYILKALIRRQTNVSIPGEVKIPLVAVSPSVIDQAPSISAPAPVTQMGTGGVHLTFDDGPGAHTEQVLDVLSRYNVHATFYVIGRNVQRYPGTMQRIKNEGHTIGNHTFTHADLTVLSEAGVRQELASTQAAIEQACGVTPSAFRPPYGAENGIVRSIAASMGMSVDLWSVDPNDWAAPGSSEITQRVLATTRPGAVVLLHVLNQQTVDALPSIIEGIRAQGYTL